MADNITDTVSTVPKIPEIPPRKFDRYAKSGEEMMDILLCCLPFFLFIAKCACPLLYKDQFEAVLNLFFHI
jgi:hypothetical protein